MLLIRSRLVQGAGGALSIAATIATRYSAVRRQFPPAEDEEENGLSGELAKEVQIIDYQSQQYRVFPHIATAYALFATGMYMRNLYEALQKGIKSNNLDALPEAHATSSGLKAVTTMLAAEGIEECRKSLGGHGYLLNSGLGDLFTAYVANNTLEGENYVIIQQLTRYLAKTFKAAQKGVTPAGNAKYLAGIAQGNKYLPVQLGKPEDLLDPQNQLNIYANRAGYLVSLFSKRMDAAISSGKTFASALQSLQWIGTRASKAHCMYTILVCMNDLVEKAKKNQPALYQPLKNLCDLFALYHAERELGEFLEASQMSPTHASWLHEQTEAALLRIRPDAVCLVDAFNHSDRDLNSALGKYDGNVYEALYNWTKLDPMNKDDVIFCYEDVIRPIIKKDFKSKL